jgi:hypothetical protein
VGERCYCWAYLHKKSEACFARKTTLTDLPVIALSTISGTLSIGSTNIFNDEKRATQYIGTLSLFISVLSTVGTYFSYAKRTESHRIAHLQYSKLFRFLNVELSLPRNERMLPSDLLKITRDTYERLSEMSPLVPQKFLTHFKKKFKKYQVAKPSECNGLESISIYTISECERENEEKEDLKTEDSLPKSGTIDDFLEAV